MTATPDLTRAASAPMPVTAGSAADEAEKLRRLNEMKRRATGMLVVAAVLVAITAWLEPRYPWLSYVRATAEAAMVGGIADWFAVTALFRQPLGLPIPHTAIIPARKDRIGKSLGNFVQNNFLSRDILAARLGAMRVTQRAAEWITVPEHARSVSRHASAAAAGAVKVLRDEDVQEMIDRSLVQRVRAAHAAPLLGSALALVTANNRHQELLDRAIGLLARVIADNETLIRDKIRTESPWWVPSAVDDRIHDKILAAVERTVREVSADPNHALRAQFDEALHDFIHRLRTSPEMTAKAEAVKEELLAHPVVRQFSTAVWADVKAGLLRHAEPGPPGPDGAPAPPGTMERGLMALGTTVLSDEEFLAKADRWIADAVLYAVEQYRGEVSALIAHTVSAWDADATSRKIELQIGRDLQFIRINGTLVGGLVGLLLHVLSRAM